MAKLSLRTKDGSRFDLDERDIKTDNFTKPFHFNPNNTRLFIIGDEFGPVVAIWADNEQEALDCMLDKGYERFLIPPEDYMAMSDDEKEDVYYLGNAGEPCDLTYAWIREADTNPSDRDGVGLLEKFIIANERGMDDLDFDI